MSGKAGDAQSEAAHRAVVTPGTDPGASSSAAAGGKRWATAKELSALAGIVLTSVGVLLGGTQWAVSSALETTLMFAVSPLREDLRLVQADVHLVQAEVRSVQAEVRSLSVGQAEIRGQLAVQGAEVSALREEVRSVQADVRALSAGQAELRERLIRVETLLEPDGSPSGGDRPVKDIRSGVPGVGGTESHPG